jgi:hypothetical protein
MNKFFTKSIPAPIVIAIFLGLLTGTVFGLYVPMVVSAQAERVATFEEVTALALVEEALRLGGFSSTEEAGFRYTTIPGIQKYDGPRLAASMPIETKEAWLAWMSRNRNDDPVFLEQRWHWAQDLVITSELNRPEDVKAFLLTPREHFVRAHNR